MDLGLEGGGLDIMRMHLNVQNELGLLQALELEGCMSYAIAKPNICTANTNTAINSIFFICICDMLLILLRDSRSLSKTSSHNMIYLISQPGVGQLCCLYLFRTCGFSTRDHVLSKTSFPHKIHLISEPFAPSTHI
jgi:hypothetical protein